MNFRIYWVWATLFFIMTIAIYGWVNNIYSFLLKDCCALSEKIYKIQFLKQFGDENWHYLYQLNKKYYEDAISKSIHNESVSHIQLTSLQLDWYQAQQGVLKYLDTHQAEKFLSKNFFKQLNQANTDELKLFYQSYQMYAWVMQSFEMMNHLKINIFHWDVSKAEISGWLNFDEFYAFLQYLWESPHDFDCFYLKWETTAVDMEAQIKNIYFHIGLSWEI